MFAPTVLFLTLGSFVAAAPHCRPHHNETATAITYWYTRHHAMSTAIAVSPTTSNSASASSAKPTAVDNATTSAASVSEVPSSTVESSIVEVTPTSSEVASSAVEASSVEVSTTSTSESVVAPTNLAAAPTNSSSSGSTGDADADLLVQLHNDFRAQYGAGPVTWSNTLADYAKSHATACNMEHTGGPYGENLAAGAGGGYSITDGFNAWAAEAPEYDPSNPQYSHFTQVVWKGTTEIGCAAVSCADGTIFTIGSDSLYIMCEYNPAGNVIGQFAENVGAKSS
ncbi:uncharacterized protein I303_108594 [Kwoniella dejecticola CBS 10117]|uniref:SCP domain-containing protein n=1 Tax=Kwoniella dejecticola CBS 10117 TaxID=1296121 RepID=A0A1A5ZWY8_9TREE|nr:uncharacterized protein I303_07081 [Kwoniella dejecticola CBS 10117]OBR82322.1 hypothetical protein I303_07081 [Kwoniella dejecticola CBS 10117]